MKELDQLKPAIHIVQTVEEKKKFGWVRSLVKIPGHTLFEVDMVANKMVPITPKQEVAIGMDGNKVVSSIVYEREHCFYLYALNEKNAAKKLLKIMKKLKGKERPSYGL